MTLTLRRLNRATLARQLLLEREPLPVADAIRRVLALQAQEPASPYLALWNRVAGFDPSDLDAAFAAREVVKGSLMRITLHAVAADDHATFHAAMLPSLRASRLYDRRFEEAGLSIEETDALLPHVVAHTAEPRTRADVERMLSHHLGRPVHERVWWAIRTFAPIVHAPTGGPWSFGRQPSHVAAPARPPADAEGAVTHLVRRYLAAFGPASRQDVTQFTMLPQRAVRPAVEALGEELVTYEGPGGEELLDVPEGPLPSEDTAAPPRLLGMWDSVLLAYRDRSRVIPEEHRSEVIRRNGDVLPTILVDGAVRGVWRPRGGGIEVTAFEPLSEAEWEGLDGEASALLELLSDRDPATYTRYGRWWRGITGAEVQVLPA